MNKLNDTMIQKCLISKEKYESTLQALYVGSTLKFSLEQRHDVISTTFQRCSNVRCPLGKFQRSLYK